MATIALVSRLFTQDDEPWFEARAQGQMRFAFRAPKDFQLKVGDAIMFAPGLLNGEANVLAFRSCGSVTIKVLSKDYKDLRDRSTVLQLLSESSQTRINLIATGEVEIYGIHPGSDSSLGMASFDSIDQFEGHLEIIGPKWLEPFWNKIGSVEMRTSILKWIQSDAIPKLRIAQKNSNDAK